MTAYTTLITTSQLNQLCASTEHLVIVDCRFSLADAAWGRREYEHGHIPGAVYAHLNEELSSAVIPGITGRHPLPDPELFVSWLGKTGISNITQLVAYDQSHGGMAARLWWLLRWVGHQHVAVLDGGWAAWQKSGYAITTEIPSLTPVKYVPVMREDLVVPVSEVGEWACDGHHKVVDAREAHRYAGLEEPIDPVAGHIPGAINIPFAGNLNSDGSWKSPEELRARFAHLLDGRTCGDVVFYCGSGVTACHDVLAFAHAGLGDAKLYAGSWSEWITDAARKVEIGEGNE